MFILNTHPNYNKPLSASDAETFGIAASDQAERFAAQRAGYRPTPLYALPALAEHAGVAMIYVKDEGQRLGMGSFKALGGYYAVVQIVCEEASRRLGRAIGLSDLDGADVRAIAGELTFGCATDGNHGKSVAAGAKAVGARSVIFVHSGVSDERVDAIAAYGAEMVRVAGTYDDSVREADRACAENGWIVVSDTSWPGYERIPGLVMQGYTAMLKEIVREIPSPPTHVFVQAGVGGLAAAVAAHFDIVYGANRPKFIVVEPDRAACLYESMRRGELTKVDHGEPTIMAMLECYEPSLLAWDILSRKADAFVAVSETEAVDAMQRLAQPEGVDPAIVAGESGGAGVAGFLHVIKNPQYAKALGIDGKSRILFLNTEGATDRGRYRKLIGKTPEEVLGSNLTAV
jgi:diaminopropionate ammonia-lyase